MRHAIPLVVIVLSALVIAEVLLPADTWTNHFVFRLAVILALSVPCYLYGIAYGKAAAGAAGKRPWLQYSLRTLLVVTTLLAICLGIYCGRVRQQRNAVEALQNIKGCSVCYDEDPVRPGNQRSRLALWSEEVLGDDFFYGVNGVEINASDAEKALPQLKRLPYLQRMSVLLDDYPKNFADQTEEVSKKVEAEMERTRTNAIKKLKAELPHAKVEEEGSPLWPGCMLPAD
jgi:hypothetical protein